MNKCSCKEWGKNIKIIDGYIVFIETTRPYMSLGEVKPFEYCPYCGKKVKLGEEPKKP